MKNRFKKNLDAAARVIRRSYSVIIGSHINPDADTLCSALALGLGLKKLRKTIYLAVADQIPQQYLSLPGANLIKRTLPTDKDLAISLDCGVIEQLGGLAKAFLSCRDILEIDHHIYRRRFGNLRLIDEQASSAAEIAFLLLKKLGISIDRRMAENLMVAIITETVSFRLPQVNSATFRICAEIMKSGLNYQKVSQRYYWQESLARLKLSGLCFSRIKQEQNGQIAWSVIWLGDFKRGGGRKEDVDAVADSMRAIKEVKISILFREIPRKRLRVSLRSKGRIDIGFLARRYGGGGHFDVASCIIPHRPLAIRNFLNQAKKLLKNK